MVKQNIESVEFNKKPVRLASRNTTTNKLVKIRIYFIEKKNAVSVNERVHKNLFIDRN